MTAARRLFAHLLVSRSIPTMRASRVAAGLIIAGASFVGGCSTNSSDSSKEDPAAAKAETSAAAKPGTDADNPPAGDGGCPDEMRSIAGGQFALGPYALRDGGEVAAQDAEVASFCLDTHEVTVEAFAACVADGACKPAGTTGYCSAGRHGGPQHPVTCVDHEQATAYCAHLGKRLPTSAEWEVAAKGGAEQRRYPWGDAEPSAELVNGCGPTCLAQFETTNPPDYDPDDAWLGTAPVGSFPKGVSRDGIQDLAGNVAEWTSSVRCPDPFQACESDNRVIRGGSFDLAGGPARLQTTGLSGNPPNMALSHIGFRCAR
jgi:formylglycine-generating enzyme required for sulfatase activity